MGIVKIKASEKIIQKPKSSGKAIPLKPVIIGAILCMILLVPIGYYFATPHTIQKHTEEVDQTRLSKQVHSYALSEVSNYWQIKFDRGDWSQTELNEAISQLPAFDKMTCDELKGFFLSKEYSNMKAHAAHLLLQNQCVL